MRTCLTKASSHDAFLSIVQTGTLIVSKEQEAFKGLYKVEFHRNLETILSMRDEGYPANKIWERLSKEGRYSGKLRGFRYHFQKLSKAPLASSDNIPAKRERSVPKAQPPAEKVKTTESKGIGPKQVTAFGANDKDKFGAKAANKNDENDLF